MAESSRVFTLDSLARLELHHIQAELVTYRGRAAVRLIESEAATAQAEPLAMVVGSHFQDGTIEFAVAADRRPEAHADARGFAGLAFRVTPRGERFECIYLRPTNGRADDQLRRNHATQYISHPDWPWYRLRNETPGVYESYTDLVPGEWTAVKIVVAGQRAQLYVNGAEQPCLIVNDLKLGKGEGALAFWIGAGTEAYFEGLSVSRLDS